MKKISKNNISKSFVEKVVVLAIVAVFIGSAFVPVVGLQTENLVLDESVEDERIKIEIVETVIEKNINSDDSPEPENYITTMNFHLKQSQDNPDPLPLDVGDIWWDYGWQYRKEITINHSKVDSDLLNFPVLIILDSDVNLSYHAQLDGDDIVFTDKIGNKLNHEIEYYNDTAGELVAWVNVTSLLSTVNTTLYMYYGNPLCGNQENVAGTWDNNFIAVYHMNSTWDSTSNSNKLTDHSTSKVDGKIGNCREFHGSDSSYMDITDPDFDLPDAFTLASWYKNNDSQAQYATLLNKEDTSGAWNDRNWWVSFTDSNEYLWFKTSGNSIDIDVGTDSLDENWHFCVAKFDKTSGDAKIILDDGTNTGSSSGNTNSEEGQEDPFFIGRSIGSSDRYWRGWIDEIRVSDITRSDAWINTTFNTINSPNAFLIISSERTRPEGNYPPSVSSPNPSDSAVGVSVPPNNFSITIYDVNGDSMNITWRTNASGSWITFNATGNKVNGTFTATDTSWVDEYNTTYWWSVNATDTLGSGNWTNETYIFTTRPEDYPPVLSNPSPTNNAIRIKLGDVTLRIMANDSDCDLMNITFRTNASGVWADIGTNTSVPNGTYSQVYTFEDSKKKYYWSVNCSDGTYWKNKTYHFTTILCISGIYPHLAAFNGAGSECSIGAVVPWANRLWYITYPAHATSGSSDKLYEVNDVLEQTIRPESVGGTHACRIIHNESNQLIIGPYFIDENRNVRTVDLNQLVGRMTGVARHLIDPENKVYFYDMEGKFYEVNVTSLNVTKLYDNIGVPGNHGKGCYSSQHRVVISNNGGGGALAQWDGENWLTVEAAQFTEVTGPEDIHGPTDNNSTLWATGWDKRSCILKLLDNGTWHTFRFPKASYTYDSGHGWYTEWPRIRGIGNGTMLMTMHGMFYNFPSTFSAQNTSDFYPVTTYHRMVVDFCDWDNDLVLASNDNSMFNNPLAGQPQSNLVFLDPETLPEFGGPPSGWGGPWVSDYITAGTLSDPFLINGFTQRVLHIYVTSVDGSNNVTFTLEVDYNGTNSWSFYNEIQVPTGGYAYHIFPENFTASWIRLNASENCKATAYFHFSSPEKWKELPNVFSSLAEINDNLSRCNGILLPSNLNRDLQFVANVTYENGSISNTFLYDIDQNLAFHLADDQSRINSIMNIANINTHFTVDNASVIIEDSGTNFRLPKTYPGYDNPWFSGWPRGIREVVTERNLMNIHGTFYELPRESGKIQGIRPLCTHGKRIYDFCSWRGLLVMSGTLTDGELDGHYFNSDMNETIGLWFGAVDDLWKLGEPRGKGGPWNNTLVLKSHPSDPYLMTGYNYKKVDLSHDANKNITFTLQVDFLHYGTWVDYKTIIVPPGEIITHEFTPGYSANWVRFISDENCNATAILTYGHWPEDSTPPEITNITATPSLITKGEWVNITCNATDGVEVSTVRVNITDPTGSSLNTTMNEGSYYYNASYTVVGTYSYFIWANDTSGNMDVSSVYTFEIIEIGDNTEVSIIPLTQTVNIDETFTVSIYCDSTESIEGFEFDLDYNATLIHANSVTEGDIFNGFDTFFNDGTINNTIGYLDNVYGIITEEGNVSDPGYLANISFTAQTNTGTSILLLVDVGITNDSAYIAIDIVNGSVTVESTGDTIPPEISDVTITISDPKDTVIGWENISCTVTDNIDVDTVLLNITYPDTSSSIISMTSPGGNSYYHNTTFSDVGTYNYYIWANDTSNNENTSSVDSFVIPPNWDMNIDHQCSIVDLVWVAGHFDETGAFGWIREDLNNDGQVSIVDLVLVSGYFDEIW